MTGIYKIENLLNGKVYIGQSIDIEQRWYRHKTNYKNKKRTCEFNKPLYRAFRKYKIDNFSFEILQECKKESLNKLELFYITQYDSNNNKNGYNLSLDGSVSTFTKLNNAVLKNIISELKTDVLKKEIANKFNISIQYLNRINQGKSLKLESEIYPIRKETDVFLLKKKKHKCKICGLETNNFKFCSKKCSSKNQKKVKNRPSKEEISVLLKTKTFVEIGRMFNVSDNTIRKWLK